MVTALEVERKAVLAEIASIRDVNADLIAKHEANEELSSVVGNHKKQVASLEEFTKREKSP